MFSVPQEETNARRKNALGLSYVIDECPPWYLSIVLGFQVTSPIRIKVSKTNRDTTQRQVMAISYARAQPYDHPFSFPNPLLPLAGKEPFLIWWSGQETVDADQRIAASGIGIRDVSYLRSSPESCRLDNGVHESTPSKITKTYRSFLSL